MDCPACATLLVLRGGRLGRVGSAILGYLPIDFVRSLAICGAIVALVVGIVAVQLSGRSSPPSPAFRCRMSGFVGGVFFNCLYNVVRGLHTGVISGLTQSMTPWRDRFRSLASQEYWSLIAFWTGIGALSGAGLAAIVFGK